MLLAMGKYGSLGSIPAPKPRPQPLPPAMGQGTAAAPSGAWPVELTDGTNILGTPANPLQVAQVVASTSSVTDLQRRLLEAELIRTIDLERLGMAGRACERISLLTERGSR